MKSSFRRKVEILSFLMEEGGATEKKLLTKLKFPNYQTLEYYIDCLSREGVVTVENGVIYPSKALVDNELATKLLEVLKKYVERYGDNQDSLINSILYIVYILLGD